MGKVLKDSQGNILLANGGAIEITSAIDPNIQAGNIKKDVTILGVTGTYEGSGGGGHKVIYEVNELTTSHPTPDEDCWNYIIEAITSEKGFVLRCDDLSVDNTSYSNVDFTLICFDDATESYLCVGFYGDGLVFADVSETEIYVYIINA